MVKSNELKKLAFKLNFRYRAVARGQPSQPMGWPGFWSETVLHYLFTRMWETTLQFFEISIHFSSKPPPFLGDNSQTTWTIVEG